MSKKIILLLALLVGVPRLTNAADNNPSGLTVSPYLMELNVAKGSTTESEVSVTNNTARDVQLTATPRDFIPGQDGQAIFVQDKITNDSTFSLASWIKLKSAEKFTLKVGEKKTIPFSVSPPANAEDGTHYGAILFSYVTNKDLGGSKIAQAVGPLVLVKYGSGKESGYAKLDVGKKINWSAEQINVFAHFINDGNVHVRPKGEVYYRNIFGRIVGTTYINRDGANVLPQTNRIFFGEWKPSKFSFGPYRAQLVLNYGDSRAETRDQIYIWVMPWYTLLILSILGLAVAYYYLEGRHRYRRRVIQKHLDEEL